jgi:hypothetical protein
MIRVAAASVFLAIACTGAEKTSSYGIDAAAPGASSNGVTPTADAGALPGLSAARAADEFLADCLPVWQQRLGLEEWKITLVMTPRIALKPGTLGGIKWDKSKKTAVMSILDSSDYTGSTEEMLRDMEFTVVHELIHLELASLPKSETSRRTEERAVNNLAKALLGLPRDRAEWRADRAALTSPP